MDARELFDGTEPLSLNSKCRSVEVILPLGFVGLHKQAASIPWSPIIPAIRNRRCRFAQLSTVSPSTHHGIPDRMQERCEGAGCSMDEAMLSRGRAATQSLVAIHHHESSRAATVASHAPSQAGASVGSVDPMAITDGGSARHRGLTAVGPPPHSLLAIVYARPIAPPVSPYL